MGEAQRPGRLTGGTGMTMTERKVIKAKVGLLELAKQLPAAPASAHTAAPRKPFWP
jgi:hypothetical protein